ncbi:MAG: 16S rRNA (cytidine(1402)-2'-O)-methyltransferase, partial [Bdellovibrionales bacterium]
MKDKNALQTIKINLDAQPLPAGLYLVGTPIGYLKDISLRALETLMSVDVVACEDTRVTGKLLHYYGIEAKKIKYNDHSDARAREEIFRRIGEGQAVALCSDAGLPLIADPGYKLVSECVDRGVYVTSIPGANAALTGLQLSGFTTDQFAFLGFLPSKAKAREDYLLQFKTLSMTQVYYET